MSLTHREIRTVLLVNLKTKICRNNLFKLMIYIKKNNAVYIKMTWTFWWMVSLQQYHSLNPRCLRNCWIKNSSTVRVEDVERKTVLTPHDTLNPGHEPGHSGVDSRSVFGSTNAPKWRDSHYIKHAIWFGHPDVKGTSRVALASVFATAEVSHTQHAIGCDPNS